MQVVYCKVKNCGFRSQNGFCLNRLTVINDQGVCNYLTKPHWREKVDEKWFNTHTPENKEEKEEEILSQENTEKVE